VINRKSYIKIKPHDIQTITVFQGKFNKMAVIHGSLSDSKSKRSSTHSSCES